VDGVVLAILGLACLRGLLRGLVREAFSVAALAAACVVAKLYYGPLADWLLAASDGRIGELAAPWLAGALLVVGAIGAVTLLGRVLRRGARAAGLGWADRAGGALLGTAEGALVAGILLASAAALVGRDHELLASSRSLATFEQLEELVAQARETPDVAAGPRRSRGAGFE
jgi:membrane protein required for colicin V production